MDRHDVANSRFYQFCERAFRRVCNIFSHLAIEKISFRETLLKRPDAFYPLTAFGINFFYLFVITPSLQRLSSYFVLA